MALPEKDYFTLTEIVERWKAAGCDHGTLADYARRDLLVFSVYLRDIGSYRRVEHDPDGTRRTIEATVYSFVSSGHRPDPLLRYLDSDDARRIFEARTGESVAVSVLYSSPLRDKECGVGYYTPRFFTADDLLVAREERDRFEVENRIKVGGSRLARSWAWLSKDGNRNTLTLLGGWGGKLLGKLFG
jgi:hypothetical protein